MIIALMSQLSEPSKNGFNGLKQCINHEKNKDKYKNIINNMKKDVPGKMIKYAYSQPNDIASSADSITKNETLNRTVIILFWNEKNINGLGFQPFETCFHKNCFSTRDKSLLHDPKYIVDAIIFYGGIDSQDDLKEMKQFKESKDLVEQRNRGIKPQVVLFMVVRLCI